MSEDHEPFFTPAERRVTVLFRPREWRAWWAAEPLITKIVSGVVALLLCGSVIALLRGFKDVSALLLFAFVLLGGVVTLSALGGVLIASVRWVLRTIGVVAVWRRIREKVLAVARAVFGIGFAVVLLVAVWPYLSLDPLKSWYGFRHHVPVDRVEIAKPPHDCEFLTAPVGEKHCHYEAQFEVFVPDGTRRLLVTYDRVED